MKGSITFAIFKVKVILGSVSNQWFSNEIWSVKVGNALSLILLETGYERRGKYVFLMVIKV